MNDHTLYLVPARWQISGSTVDVAGNPNVAVGAAVIQHEGGSWSVEEQINELTTRFRIQPLESGATAARFEGLNGLFGELGGSLVFFEDLILSTYRSRDGRYHGCEAFRRIAPDRYESFGALFLEGSHVSSWSYALLRT